ncbi:MAG: toll/interleukin-1 receptor domain-containing protein [Anaerolineae bacterium]
MMNALSPKIFVSYRRTDTQYMTDRLVDHLGSAFRASNVFQDVGHVPFGEDFRTYIAEQIRQCDIVLVMIGEQWVEEIRSRAGRVDDFVRLEVEQAIEQKKLIIPILVDRAVMPEPSDLPASIADIVFRNAAPLRANPDFDNDLQHLIEQINAWCLKNGLKLPSVTHISPSSPGLQNQPPIRTGRYWIDTLISPLNWKEWLMICVLIMIVIGMLTEFLPNYNYVHDRTFFYLLTSTIIWPGLLYGVLPYNLILLTIRWIGKYNRDHKRKGQEASRSS